MTRGQSTQPQQNPKESQARRKEGEEFRSEKGRVTRDGRSNLGVAVHMLSTEKTSDLDLRENFGSVVFELAQLVGITSTMYTFTGFLDPNTRGFLFVNFLGRSGVCRPNRRTER